MLHNFIPHPPKGQTASPLRAFPRVEIGDNRAPQVEVGIANLALRRRRRFVWSDFDPTPGGASVAVAA